MHQEIDASDNNYIREIGPIVGTPPNMNATFGRREQFAIHHVLRLKPTVQINAVGVPEISLPLKPSEKNKEAACSFQPIMSNRVRAEISALVFEMEQCVLSGPELSRIQTILEGKAWRAPRPELGLNEILDTSPLVEGIYIYLGTQNGSFDRSCTKLLQELRQLGKRRGIDLRSKEWPKGPAQLSRKLDEQSDNLNRVGIQFKRGRRPGGERYVKLKAIPHIKPNAESDDVENRASQVASNNEPIDFQENLTCDAGDDTLERELASVNQPLEESNDDVENTTP